MKIDIMGVRFDNVTMSEALNRAEVLLSGTGAGYCVTPNSEMVYEAIHDDSLLEILNQADLVLPDGSGVVLASKILKKPLKEKVAGVDFASNLLTILEQQGKSLYLLGAKPGIAELAAVKMRSLHPKLMIAGMHDGYFQNDSDVIEEINRLSPDVLFVCLGVPRQERFMAEHRHELQVRMMIGLGGTLDSFAGTVKRAPKWMIRMNLEWLYRLIKEPWRFRRMLRLPKFLFAVIRRRNGGTASWEN